MKQFIFMIAGVFLMLSAYAQTPEKVSYQAVLRNAENEPIANQEVGLRLSILEGTTNGTAVFAETHTTMTNVNGLVSVDLGAGTHESGSIFAQIDWSAGPYFIKMETDPTGGTDYTIEGVSQLLSVPYALYSKSVKVAVSDSKDTLYIGEDKWVIIDGISGDNSENYCSGTTTLSEATGTFDDGSGEDEDYGPNSSCTWLVAPEGATAVQLDFTSFDLADGDQVRVYRGSSASFFNSLGTFTSANPPTSQITSNQGSMLVVFTSNGFVQAGGWEATYTSTPACSGLTELTAQSGSLSDGSPGNYGPNFDCQWRISPANAERVNFSFTSFSLGNGDYVRVYDGEDDSATLLGLFSRFSNTSQTLVATSGKVFVTFETNASSQGAGWSAQWNTVPEGQVQCNGTQELTDRRGVFEDGSGIYEYGNNSDCSWLIQPKGATTIALKFTQFDVAADDTVRVYDGKIADDDFLLGKFSGTALPPEVVSTGGSMLVHFMSDDSVRAQGWTAEYGFPSGVELCAAGQTTDVVERYSTSGKYWMDRNLGAQSQSANGDLYQWGRFADGHQCRNSQTTDAQASTADASESQAWYGKFIALEASPSDWLSSQDNDLWDGKEGQNNPCPVEYRLPTAAEWQAELNRSLIGSLPKTGYRRGDNGTIEETGDEGYYWSSTVSSTKARSLFIHSGGAELIDDHRGNGSAIRCIQDNDPTPQTFCSGRTNLFSATGTISDGSDDEDYGPNSACEYLIQPSGADAIALTITELSLEKDFDFLYVYNGSSTSSPLLGVFTGDTIPPQLVSTSGRMLLRFTSDGNTGAPGWSAFYEATYCDGISSFSNLNGGPITDGSGSNDYGPNSDCQYRISLSSSVTSVELKFTSFDVAENDTVKVYKGLSANEDELLGAFSGSALPPVLSVDGRQMLITFQSDSTNQAEGWAATYTPGFCSGKTILTSNSGSFSDGSSFRNYGPNADCSWLIQPASDPYSIDLTFNSFALASGDVVTVYDGDSTDAPVLGTFTGYSTPSPITSTGNAIFIRFTSDGSSQAGGFSASWAPSPVFCSSTDILTAPTGSLTDGSGSGAYGPNSDCKWLIQPEGASSVELSFTMFTIEDGNDFVRVYDGPTTSSPLLGEFTGSSIPQTLISTGPSMLVHFTTNGSRQSEGWTAVYGYPSGNVKCNEDDLPTAVVDVESPTTGEEWMDRNLGASLYAEDTDDVLAYGDLYQWGRFADGHQCRNSATTSTLATTSTPSTGGAWDEKFVIGNADWLSSSQDNLWDGVASQNNPCPGGYRLPSDAEWQAELTGWGSLDRDGAVNSFLKLPSTGYRQRSTGTLSSEGSSGYYWTSTVNGSSARYLFFNDSSAYINANDRARGHAVRCIKE